jgi:hypothetical protein
MAARSNWRAAASRRLHVGLGLRIAVIRIRIVERVFVDLAVGLVVGLEISGGPVVAGHALR